jgi:VCBS repeat protein
VLLNHGDGSFMSPAHYRVGDAPSSVAIVDLNGDGKPDLATAAYEGSSALLLSRGDGKFGPGRHYDGTTGQSLLVAADFDADGKQDLAVATNDETGDFSDGEGRRAARCGWLLAGASARNANPSLILS